MSQLLLSPISHEDARPCAQLRITILGSLVIGRPPPYPGFLESQIATIQNDIASKPHVRHLKVAEADKIIAYAKWEIYPAGRPDIEQVNKPIDEESKSVDHYGRLREAAHEYFCRRNGGPIGSRPHILLALLVMSSEHRRKGAGGLLLQWGVEKAEEMGLPCYVQASAQGKRLYGKYGFQAIDVTQYDLYQYGLDGVETMTEMIREPSKDRR